jgi:hypothetical protein
VTKRNESPHAHFVNALRNALGLAPLPGIELGVHIREARDERFVRQLSRHAGDGHRQGDKILGGMKRL